MDDERKHKLRIAAVNRSRKVSCLSIICVYASLSAGVANREVAVYEMSPFDGAVIVNASETTAGRNLGMAEIGIESKHGFFIQVNHVSGIDRGGDKGYESIDVGIRKSWALIK